MRADALRAEAWAGEPFLRTDEDPEAVLAPGTARRRALDDALAEIEAGAKDAVERVEGALRAHARARARPLRAAAQARLRHRAPAPSGRRARRHAHRADRGRAEERERKRPRERQRRRRAARGGRRARGRARASRPTPTADDEELPPEPQEDPGAVRRYRFRHPTASGKTIAAVRLRRGRAHRRRSDPHAPPSARRPVPPRAHRARLRRPPRRSDPRRAHGEAPGRADHDPDVRLVRAARRRDRAARVPARHLRRGTHRARREDVRRDPLARRAGLHRHDRDGGVDREAGLRRLPRFGRRPAAGGCRAARIDRAAPLPPRAAGRGDQPGADRRRRLRGARTRAGPRPRGAQHGRGDALPRAVRRHAGRRLRGRRRARVQPRDRVPRGRHQGRSGLGTHAAGQAGGDPRRLRARRDRRADQRDAARRGLELAARDRDHAPRADGVEARLPAAHRPHHAHPSAQRGGHRRRLHAEGGDAQRTRCLAALAARRGLLPRGRARDACASPADAAARTAAGSRRHRGSFRSRPTCCAARW